ncbi:MAG: hypothetical protein ABI664_01615 [bacterium]
MTGLLADSSAASKPILRDANDVRTSLRGVLDALCHGIGQANGPGNAEEVAKFTALAEDVRVSMAERIPPELQRLSFLGNVARDTALAAARSGKAAQAEEALLRARNSVAGYEPELTRFADTLTEAVAAYVDYKQQRFPEARAGLELSLDATNRMMTDYRCEKMQLRRVHLVANIVRMGARNGDAAGALDIASGILSYLEGDEASWPLPGYEVASPIAAIPLEHRVMLSGTLGGEIALVLSASSSNLGSVLGRLAKHASLTSMSATSACAPFRPIHQWLRLRWAHCYGGPDGFLNAARQFFAVKQPGGFWADGARLLDRFCAPLDVEDAAHIRSTLAAAFVNKTTDMSSIRL